MQPNENNDPNQTQPEVQPVTPVETPYVAPTVESPAEPVVQPTVEPTPITPVTEPVVNPANPFAPAPEATPVAPIDPLAPVAAAPVAPVAKKSPMKLIIIIAAIVLGLGILGTVAALALRTVAPNLLPAALSAGIPLETYSKEGKFSLKVPQGWVAKETDAGATMTFVSFYKASEVPAEDATAETRVTPTAAITVIGYDYAGQESTIQKTEEEFLTTMKASVERLKAGTETSPGITVVSSGETKVGNYTAFKSIYNSTRGTGDAAKAGFAGSLTVYVSPTVQYNVSVGGYESETALKASLDTILDSFKLS